MGFNRSVPFTQFPLRSLSLCVMLLWWSGCDRDPGDNRPQLTKVRIAVPSSPMSYLPVYLTPELGYDREEGIQLITEDMSGGSKAL